MTAPINITRYHEPIYRKRWKEADVEFMKANCRFLTVEEMSIELNCSIKSIRGKLTKLKLSCRRKCNWDYAKYQRAIKLQRNKAINWAIENRLKGRMINV